MGRCTAPTNFPALIGEDGISVLPITSLALNHKVSTERIGTGIPRLDAMLGGKGFFRGSSVLLTGTAGTGKTIISSNFAQAACKRGERVLFFSFEESPNQIIRNMHSIGLAPGTTGQERPAAVSLGAALALRTRNAYGHNVPGDRRIQTPRRHH